MRNRAIQVKMVKTQDQDESNPVIDPPFETKVIVISDCVKDAVAFAAKMALAYVVIDTVRQVAIEKAKQ